MSGRGGALRGDQPARIGAVVRFMRQCALPWKEIAGELGVSERQARRWLGAAQNDNDRAEAVAAEEAAR